MKTLYFIYALLFEGVSVIQIDEYMDGNIKWGALDGPQDYNGSHNCNWADGKTAIEAVWNLKDL